MHSVSPALNLKPLKASTELQKKLTVWMGTEWVGNGMGKVGNKKLSTFNSLLRCPITHSHDCCYAVIALISAINVTRVRTIM